MVLSAQKFVPGEVMVRLKQASEESFARDFDCQVTDRFDLSSGPIFKLHLPGDLSTAQALREMQSDPRVASAEPNFG